MSAEKGKGGKRLFRSAIGGYNKSDVNEYLVLTDAEYSEKEKALREMLRRAEEGAEHAAGTFDAADPSRESDTEKIKELEAELEKLRAETERLKKENEELSARTAAHAEPIPENYGSLLEKSRLYDETAEKIGETMLMAKKTAEETVAAAKAEADEIVASAEKDASKVRKASEERAKKAFDEIFALLKKAAEENFSEIEKNSAFAGESMRKAMTEIRANNASVSEQLAWEENSVWSEIRSVINRLFSGSDKQ
ncbi:MAG: hypothetical protein ACI4QZ_02655 [Eubacteriales bacterium]